MVDGGMRAQEGLGGGAEGDGGNFGDFGEAGVGAGCPFDVIILSRRDVFRALYPILHGACHGVPLVRPPAYTLMPPPFIYPFLQGACHCVPLFRPAACTLMPRTSLPPST